MDGIEDCKSKVESCSFVIQRNIDVFDIFLLC